MNCLRDYCYISYITCIHRQPNANMMICILSSLLFDVIHIVLTATNNPIHSICNSSNSSIITIITIIKIALNTWATLVMV